MFRFIEKLQNADETIKRRWMFALTAVAMVVVVFVWLAYFNNLVSGGFTEPDFAAAEPAESNSFTFFETFKSGLAFAYRTFFGLLHGFGAILSEPREYIISPPQ